MDQTCFETAIAILRNDFVVEVATSPETVIDALRLRHVVYCQERSFEPGLDGIETDQFDRAAHHVLLRCRATREVVGTVRLVTPMRDELPMERLARFPKLRQCPRNQIAEVSRFALSKSWRVANGWPCNLLRLALIRGIVEVSGKMELNYWCALVEPKLLRLLHTSAIYFRPAGDMVEHRGWRQPSFIALSEMFNHMRREKPAVWDFVTDQGALWRETTFISARS